VEMRIDGDQDAVWLRVAVAASTHSEPANCQIGHHSYFYRNVESRTGQIIYAEKGKTFDTEVA